MHHSRRARTLKAAMQAERRLAMSFLVRLCLAACHLIRRKMPSAFVSLGLVVLCAAAYMLFALPSSPAPPLSPPTQERPPRAQQTQSPPPASKQEPRPKQTLSVEARRVQSIIDEQVRQAGGHEKADILNLVSASIEPGNRQFRKRYQLQPCAAASHGISACGRNLLGFLFASLHLTFACHAQVANQITSLDSVVFPEGLTELVLVSFHYCRHCFMVCT
jgi:hypothetical protein